MLSSLNADLHSHSTRSDGVLTPSALAERAKRNGVELWALTDHDEVSGIAEARAAAADLRMPFIAGVEVSVTWAGKTVHIVGLGIDENNADLKEGLRQTRSGRERRAHDIAAELEKAAGIRGAYEGAMQYVGNPDLISRSHFARFLVEKGVCKSVSEVFQHYLADGKPGFVAHRWVKLSDALGWIQQAGGVAVIAHPGRYDLSDVALTALMEEFKQLGGVAIETVTGSHTPDQYAEFHNIARRMQFDSSRGSDFHSPDDCEVDIGFLPALKPSATPVWHRWQQLL